MNAPYPIRTADPDKWQDVGLSEPTLDERLRFIDLTFECFRQAKQENEAVEGPLYPAFHDDPTSARSLAIGRRTALLRIARMADEGLPLSLLSKRDQAALSDDQLKLLSKGQRGFKREMGR